MYIDWCYTLSAKTLLEQTLPKRLRKEGYTNLQKGEKFLYAPGEVPVLLTAHVDTVHRTSPPARVLYDKKQKMLWSPDGIGGDDRAGISIIVKLLEKGYRPHVLFCDEEETGCQGAGEAVSQMESPKVNFIVGLDRKGDNDACFYSCGNKDFHKFILEKYGFDEAHGSATDISVLCPAWDIAGVNLSVGYYNAHRDAEYVDLDIVSFTVMRVAWMLSEVIIDGCPEFDYQPPVTTYKRYGSAKTSTAAKRDRHGSYSSAEWEAYYGTQSTGKYTVVPYTKRHLGVQIDLDDLIGIFGGTFTQWRDWWDKEKKDIEELVEAEVQAEVATRAEEALMTGSLLHKST